MKRKWYRNKENSYYLEFADSHIEPLYTTPDGKLALKYLEKKLTKKEYNGLNKIGEYLILKKAIGLKKKLAWNEAEAKTRKIDIAELQKKMTEGNASIEAYNNYIVEPAKQEFDNYYAFVEMEKNLEKEFTDFFEKFNKKQFLQIIAKTLYLLAVFNTTKTLHQLANLQKSWQAEFKQTIKKIKNKRKGEQAKELLKVVLGDKIEDTEAIRKEEEKDVEKYGKRLFDISINLDEELDLSRLHWGDYSIKTMKLYSPEMPQILEDHHKTIDITINQIPETFSLEEYYELKINTISSEMLRNSKDLLDNILIVYAIKRAQNGDEKAVKVLFNCYKDNAEGLAVNFINKKAGGLIKDVAKPKFNQVGQLSYENVKMVVKEILYLLLSGDRPSSLFKYLDSAKEEKPEIGILLHRRIYNILMESYNVAYMTLITIIKTIYSQNLIFKRQMRNMNYQMNKAIKSQKESIELEYLAKIFNLALHQINWISANTLTATAVLTPYNFAVYSPSFNKAVFKPSKKCNLTTWIFGSKKFSGMLWQKLNDWYRGQTFIEKGRRLVKLLRQGR